MPRRPTPAAPSAVTVADRMHSASLRLLRRLRVHDEAMGISAARASALSVAVFGGPVTLGRLAAAEQVSAPTITRLVVAMEEEGLLKREPDATDRRVIWIRPTAKGSKLLTEGRRRRVEALANELATLTEQDLAIIARAAEILATLGAQPSPPLGATNRGQAPARTRRGRRRHI